MKAVQQDKQRFSDTSDDDDEEDVEAKVKNELFNVIWSNDSETEKVKKIRKIFQTAPKLEINFQGIDNDTCLHIAVRQKELKVIELLVKKGARTDIKNDKNRSPLDDAERLKRQDILEMLQPENQQIFVEEQKESNQENSDGRSKNSEQENIILRSNDDELPSKKDLNSHKDDQTTEEKYNKLTYEKRPGTTGMHGQLYEINLLMLLLLQAEAKEKAKIINSFYLATNMQGAGAFDDVVFKYKHTEDGIKKSQIIFLQAKHKEANKGKRFTIDALLSQTGKGDFQLRKYLSSYIRIRQFKFKEDHPLFLDGIDRSDFVIYTNSVWSFEKNKYCVKTINLKPEDALNFSENTTNYYYQLNANETVKSALRDSLDFEMLVRELAQSVCSGNIKLSKDIFKDYHVTLADRVLQISETNKEECQLRQDFLDGKENVEFSHAFLEEVRKNINVCKTFTTKLDGTLNEKLRNQIIKIPKDFGSAQDNELNLPLPNKTIPDETIKEFLEKLKIFTDQPNVNDLEITIKKMIKDVFRIEEKDANLVYCDVHSKITKWWRKEEKVKYLTEHNKLFHNAKESLSILHLVGLAILYAKRIKSLGLSFKSDHIQTLSNLMRKKRILHIISDEDAVLLSTAKVYQAIEEMTEYQSKNDNHKYIFLSLTSALQLQHKVISTFKSKKRNLLVIECEGTETNFKEFYVQLQNIVKLNESKKIVLITRENDRFGEQFKRDFSGDSHYQEEIDRNHTLADLDIQSQAFIERKKVVFQGVKMELGTLVDGKSKHLVASDVLSKVINGERINVGKTPDDLGEVKYYYINRRFHRRVNIKKECFKDTHTQDIFVVSNVTDNEFSVLADGETVRKLKDIDLDKQNPIRIIILDDDQNIQETLKHLYTKYQTSNIHWVKKQGDKFIWQQSHGSLSNLRKFVDTEDITEYPTENISNIENKIVIVSAEPGMGKSVLLTKLAGKEKETDPSTWVARINLSDFTKQLNEMHFDENKLMTRTINFLCDILDLKTPLERQLFKHRVENIGKVILFFDGFDEISPNYKEKVIALVKILKETKINKLWITTRPHMKDELEDNLNVLSYSLKPLSTEDQKHFLKKFWSKKLDLKDDNDDWRFNSYIEQLLEVWSLSIGDEERDFAGIPLQTKMLAEIYQDKFQEFYNSNQSIPSFPSKLNLLDLYQSFIDKKYDIYWLEKNKVDKTIPSMNTVFDQYHAKFMANHQLLALDVILSEQDRNLILDKKEKEDLINFKYGAINGLERTGIINLNPNNQLVFIHRTFAEYFTAFWLTHNLDRRGVKNLLNSKLFETGNKVLRSFFDRILASGENNRRKNELHNAVLTNDIIKVKEFCSGSRNSDVDKGGRTALHLAAAYGLLEIAKVLLENNSEAISIKDTIFGWHPLSYADKGNYWHVAELLLQHGAVGDDDMSNAISNISSVNIYGSTLLHTAAEEGLCKFAQLLIRKKANINATNYHKETPLHSAARNGNLHVVKLLAEKRADVQCQDENGETVLHSAAINGNLDLVKFLVEKGADVQCQVENGETVLHSAAINGNLDVVKFLAEKGADLKCKNKKGETVLHYATINGNLHVVKFLAEKGADVQCQNIKGETVLHSAASRGNLDVVKLLAEKGADVQCQDENGETVLHSAAINGNLGLVKFLAEKGADVQCQEENGETVLHYAARNGNMDVVKFLAEKGADLKCKNKKGETVLHSAAYRRNWDVVKFLAEKGADVLCRDKYGETVLHCAARNGNLDVVKFLAEKGADVQCQDENGETVLHSAARNGNLHVVKFLLEKGADVLCQDKYGRTVLDYAASRGHFDVVKFLAEKGADVQCQNRVGETVLHYAASRGNLDVIKFLAEKGADVQCQDENGETVLHYAASSGHLDVVKFLTEKGADVQCQNIKGETVLHFAAYRRNWDVVKFLVEKGAEVQCQDENGEAVLHSAARNGNLHVVKFLTEKGADVQCQNIKGETVLHSAAYRRNWDVVKFLAEKGAKVQCQDENGETVLHSAARNGNLHVVKFLLEKGADVLCQDKYGRTVLHYAASRGHFDVVKFLTEKGADVQCQEENGETVLHYAARNGNMDVVKFLAEKGADLKCKNKDGETVLHCAAINGNLDVVMLLAEKGADVQCQDENGETVLHDAASSGHLDVVKFLAEKGAYLKCKNKKRRNCSAFCCFSRIFRCSKVPRRKRS